MIPPICHIEEIPLASANALLVEWEHRMGACNRPNGRIWAHALLAHGKPVALTVTASLIRERSAGFARAEALELARVCAAAPDLCRPMVRLWRLFVWPELARACKARVAISYQDEALHSGNLYRFDGWREVRRSRSGTDKRSGQKGRNKRIWAWPPDEMAACVGDEG